MNAIHAGLVVPHVDDPSLKAKPSKSRSIPSNPLAVTVATICATNAARVVGLAITAAMRRAGIPSVIVGSTFTPVARMAGRTDALLAAYDAAATDDADPFHFAVYQNGDTSVNRSALAANEVIAEDEVELK